MIKSQECTHIHKQKHDYLPHHINISMGKSPTSTATSICFSSTSKKTHKLSTFSQKLCQSSAFIVLYFGISVFHTLNVDCTFFQRIIPYFQLHYVYELFIMNSCFWGHNVHLMQQRQTLPVQQKLRKFSTTLSLAACSCDYGYN